MRRNRGMRRTEEILSESESEYENGDGNEDEKGSRLHLHHEMLEFMARTTTRTSKLLKAANLLQNNPTSASAASSSTSASLNAGLPAASFPISNAQAKNSLSFSSSVSLLSMPSTAFGRALKRSRGRKALAAFKRTVRMKTYTNSRIAPPEFKSEVLGLTNKMGGSGNNINNNNNSKKKKLLRVGMWQVLLAIPRGRPPKMRRKKMMTAMGLSQQVQKSEGCANANATAQNTRRLESTAAALESKRKLGNKKKVKKDEKGKRRKEKDKERIISVELLSKKLELLCVADGSITFDSFESDTRKTSGRSRSDIEWNGYDEEVDDKEEEEEEEDVELDRILSAKISMTSTRANRQTPKKIRFVFEYGTSSTFNSAKIRENSSIEATFITTEMKDREKRDSLTKLMKNTLKQIHGRIIPTINPTDIRLYANLVQEEESKAKKQKRKFLPRGKGKNMNYLIRNEERKE
ncbi:uncharacterized protein MONOS_15121 [Monocercomonoides exilis]|uniref:uncharacterized protein n=1 Tax=Monocercomonoides exilis TaxID=2049356 RepID=UPI00355A54E9|nr:hypothetical protein MONOS_15121 [Monocercomonoides exilis]|eukprot:MONOS_15121.1-p1 / transcript=MONOS_15121.1 / gene=MONOS_15121 / organism=Monocercomonoides_exilis_PA203 / gene_product=unspecified product / transcript_product=unspecified product / location=Mono_scaffold01149:10939-12814(-) / protein_length=463 / sequence_SO=supercontig / SO=protein_coding / is_pseudo=false